MTNRSFLQRDEFRVVFRLGRLGDLALSTGVLEHWRASRGLSFSVITRREYAPLFKGHPAVCEVVEIEPGDLASLGAWFARCRELVGRFRGMELLDLHGTLRSRLLSRLWRGPVRRYPKMALARRLYNSFGLDGAARRLESVNVAQRYALALDGDPPSLESLRPLIALDQAEKEAASLALEEAGSRPGNAVALHPYATHPAKAWPRENWLELVRLLEGRGRDWFVVGRSDDPLFPGDPRDFTNATDLRRTCALLSRAAVLVTGDSGPMHLAPAVGTPVTALFGPTVKAWGFMPFGEGDRVLEQDLPCRPCSLHGGTGCARGTECLASIAPEEILENLPPGGEGPMKKLYFDHNATTPVASEVLTAMEPWFRERFGNPTSGHQWGRAAKKGLERARSQVASLIGADPGQVVFTANATESNNMVIQGLGPGPGMRLATSVVEHPAVLGPAGLMESRGATVFRVGVDGCGVVDLDRLERDLGKEADLVSLMLANNETGAVQPVAEAARIARRAGARMHTDAAQAVGKIPVDVDSLGVDYLTVAGHKLYAPKGVGALYLREPGSLTPLLLGGAQEGGIRHGTENVALAVGLGAACALARGDMHGEEERQRKLGDRFLAGLSCLDVDHLLFSTGARRLPNTAMVGFSGFDGGSLVSGMDELEVAVSAGAACHGGEGRLSHVLEAMGAEKRYAMGAVRFSWGRSTVFEDVDALLVRLARVLGRRA